MVSWLLAVLRVVRVARLLRDLVVAFLGGRGDWSLMLLLSPSAGTLGVVSPSILPEWGLSVVSQFIFFMCYILLK